MRLILAAINDERNVVAMAMGGKLNHGPKVNRVPHLRAELRPSSVHHSLLRFQTSRTRAKLSFRLLLLNWTCVIAVDQGIIGHAYAELPLRLLPSIIPVKHIHEKLERLPSELYITTIRGIEAHSVAGPMSAFPDTLLIWHDRLGHPRRDMMRCILKSSHGHKLHRYVGLPPCKVCSLGKLNTQPSYTKIIHDPP
ncbi:hypothetical protein ACFX10_025777 [Malus domestica]